MFIPATRERKAKLSALNFSIRLEFDQEIKRAMISSLLPIDSPVTAPPVDRLARAKAPSGNSLGALLRHQKSISVGMDFGPLFDR